MHPCDAAIAELRVQPGDGACGCARLMAGFFAALLGAVRLLSIWCLSVGVEQGAFGRAVGEVRKSVVSELT